jgi:Rne/Rng family ribonuclease
MNKELFVSSTPHETKVGLVEDDLLAEIYLERENEYTLAGSIYKGRVTRVLPGMQSAFVDIGLERDAFLYVSDFMELEEQDEDLTDAVPANRGVQDLRPQPVRNDAVAVTEVSGSEGTVEAERLSPPDDDNVSDESNHAAEVSPVEQAGTQRETGNSGENRDRGNWRGRRRRRGGRRDRFDRGGERNSGGSERESETRYARPAENSRGTDSNRGHVAGPPAGYQPILLPGESISKYQRWAQPSRVETTLSQPADVIEDTLVHPSDGEAPVSSAFPEDEPNFAAGRSLAEPLQEEHEDHRAFVEESGHGEAGHEDSAHDERVHEESVESASVSTDWNHEFRRPDPASAAAPAPAWNRSPDAVEITEEGSVEEEDLEEDRSDVIAERIDSSAPRDAQAPVFAAPGTMEEETIDEEEADSIRYHALPEEDFEEFEEETHAAGSGLNGEAREAVSEIHAASAETESGVTHDFIEGAEHVAEATPAEGEDDTEEIELEEAQAEAEAMLEAEARGNGTVDARVEVRAPSATAGYTQRAPRPAWERRGQRGRRSGGGGGGGRRFRRRESAPVPLISDLLKEGQEILVQIAKEPIGKKGARITSHIALPGRFLVYMPTVNHTGVSRKISSEEERQRLKRIILSERENGHGGFIVRTAAQNASEDELRADIRFLKGLWNEIRGRADNSKPPALIYHDLNVVERVLRDQVTSDFNVIWVDTEPEYERILRFFNRFQPALVKRVKLYTKETPLFEQFGLTEEMNKALKSKVWLKSGGYIVINQTEALVAIDINTGKYVGKTQRLEDTIVKTNVDAIKEIVRQIRLRDLGGIIIIDFIDMDERRNRQRVMQALEEELRHDRAPSKTLQFNDFGLVAITRKRVKQSLERTIGAPCPYCQSTGYVKSVTTICNEIYVEMRKIAKHLEHADVMLRVNPDVAKELKTNNGRLLNEMEELTKRTIIVKSDPALHQEQFDIN